MTKQASNTKSARTTTGRFDKHFVQVEGSGRKIMCKHCETKIDPNPTLGINQRRNDHLSKCEKYLEEVKRLQSLQLSISIRSDLVAPEVTVPPTKTPDDPPVKPQVDQHDDSSMTRMWIFLFM